MHKQSSYLTTKKQTHCKEKDTDGSQRTDVKHCTRHIGAQETQTRGFGTLGYLWRQSQSFLVIRQFHFDIQLVLGY